MSVVPHILTVGTGAIGAIYSWRLAQSCEITTVCRSNYETVKEKGFKIESQKFGDGVFHPHKVARTVSECVTTKPFDYILVTLKALPEIYNVADIIAPAVTENTTLVLIQNGLGVEEPIVAKFPNNPLISIVAYISTSQHEPGTITMLAKESLIVGKYLKSNCSSDKQQSLFVEHLRKGGVQVDVVEDVEQVRWQKLIWNASFSSVCTMTGMTTTEVLESKEALVAIRGIMREVITAANAEGYDFDQESQIEGLITRTQMSAKNYKPSMQLDRERGSPMEIEVILGAPLKRAKAKQLLVPQLEIMHSICSAANQLIINKMSRL
ncbi:unnamed protein product [Rhizopus stolonifer]